MIPEANLNAYKVEFLEAGTYRTGELLKYSVFCLSNNISTDLISYG
jgi:hypothetical protein